MNKAVVLLSGGLDSATTAALARDQGYQLYALTFEYGQRHAWELNAARRVAQALQVHDHIVQRFDLRAFGGSALTGELPIPKDRREIGIQSEIPVTYVPARNTIFLSFALAYAEVIGAGDIFIGVSAVDYSGYPDCRPEYLERFQALACLATRAGLEGRALQIHAPLIDLSKAETIRRGTRLGVVYSLTMSCYDPSPEGLACGRCDSCRLRRQGFEDAGVPDPTRYQLAIA